MSAASSPESKRRGSTSATEDDIIPLIIAGNPGLVLNYKQMAARSKGKYTWSSLEHKFRKWKAVAKELQVDKEEGTEGGAASSTVETAKKRQTAKPPAKRHRAAVKKENQDQDSEDEEEEGKKKKPVKRSKMGSADAEEEPVIKEEIRKAAQKLKEASKDGVSPVPELPKGQKKGTARVVKKDGLRGGRDDEEDEAEVKGNGKGNKGKTKAVKVEESEDEDSFDGGHGRNPDDYSPEYLHHPDQMGH